MAKGITGIILAGGQSRRMGRDKTRLPWAGTTLLEHVVEALRPVVDEIIVSVCDASAFRHLKARVVEDLIHGAHALGGLYTGLKLASHERCFVCGCDAPFLNPDLIRFLFEQVDGCDLVVPKTRQGLQPLHAIYATSALPAVEAQLERRQWDLGALVSRVRAKIVEADVMKRFDPQGLSFFNLNSPEDYAQACELQATLTDVIDDCTKPGTLRA